MAWLEYVLAFVGFILAHSLPLRPKVRAWLARKIGLIGFSVAYSALSLGLLAWLIGAASRAPFIPLWEGAHWQRTAPLLGMAAACVILAMTLGRPNPFSFGGRRSVDFDPTRPGIVRWTRHPILVALALWSATHIPPNGDLAHVALFGVFTIFALIGGRMIDRRKRASWSLWGETRDATRQAPALKLGMAPLEIGTRLMCAVAIYVGLLVLHPVLIGVSPFP